MSTWVEDVYGAEEGIKADRYAKAGDTSGWTT